MNLIWKRPDGGISVTHPAAGQDLGELAAILQGRGDIPADYELVCVGAELPADREFRGAWSWETPEPVVDINLPKAKEIAHEKRRAKREVEFAPHDNIIAKQIPGKSLQDAETARAAIRTKYDTVQTDIDAAADVATLKTVLGGM